MESQLTTLGAGASEVSLFEKVVEEGFKYNILELGFLLQDDGYLKGYIGDNKVDDLRGKAYPTMDDRAVVNREVNAGQKIKFDGSSVAGGDFAVLMIYDKIKL